MSDLTPRLDLPLIKPSQAQKHVTHNEALQVLDGLVQAALEETEAVTPPFEADAGALYALGAAPTGDWADQGGKLALFAGGGWLFIDPREGWRAWDKATGKLRFFDGTSWIAQAADLNNVEVVGVNTTADTTNRFSVKSDASLLSHDGAGHQVKINKSGAGDTASLLFQSNWTGHAEMGLAGDTTFSVKVSDNGSNWQNAIIADAASGTLSLGLPVVGDAVQHFASDDTPGRLLRSGAAATVLAGGAESRAVYGGTADAILLNSGAALSAVPVGYQVRFRASSNNTGATTLNLDSTGGIACKTVTGADLPADYIRTDADTVALYDGTHWILDRVLEFGANASGEFVRSANGSQHCCVKLVATYESAHRLIAYWTYPAAFVNAAAVLSSTDGNASSSVGFDRNDIMYVGARHAGSQAILRIFKHPTAASFVSGDEQRDVSAVAFGRWY